MTLPGTRLSERRQHQLLRSYGTQSLDAILIDPVAGIADAKSSARGSRHHYIGDEPPCRMQTRTDGIGFGGEWDQPAELLTWAQVKRLAKNIPDDLREEIRQLRRRWNHHHSAYPRFAASPAAVGCGPFPKVGPLTQRQTRYAEELAEWESSGLEQAWSAEKSQIETERARLHDLALPLSVNNEAVDLLELLDEFSADQPGRSPAARTAVAARPATYGTWKQPARGAGVGVQP
jgi:hypothetical protein